MRSSIVHVSSNVDDQTITRNITWFGVMVFVIAIGIFALANAIG
ncbi:MAG: hypothetical protein R3E84_04975 [Pseudomonadales bacterium]